MKKIITITAICLFSFPALGGIYDSIFNNNSRGAGIYSVYDYSDSEIEDIERRIEERRDARNFKPKNWIPNVPDLEVIDFNTID